MKLSCEIEQPEHNVPRERTRSFWNFTKEMYHTRVWLLLLVRWISYTGQFCFFPHFQTEATNFFAARHTEADIECTGKHANHADPPEACKQAHDDVIFFTTIRSLAYAFCLSLIFNPAVGTWSDMYGRKAFFVYSLASHVVTATVIQMYLVFGLPLYWYYILGAVVYPFSGSSVALAYISDVVSEEHRIFAFGLSALTINLGAVCGTLLPITGVVNDINNASLAMGGLSFFASILAAVFLPESLSKDIQLATREAASSKSGLSSWKKSIVFAQESFIRSMKILIRTKLFRRLALIFFIVCLCSEEYIEYSAQYLQEVLGFGTTELARTTLYGSLTGMVLLTFGSWFMVFGVKVTDKVILVLGTLFVCLAMGLLAIVQTDWMAYAASCCFSFWAIASMAISSFKANNVEKSEQGAVQGALNAVSSVGFGVGPLLFMTLFKVFRSGGVYIPGAPYYFGFAAMVFALFLAATVQPPSTQKPSTGVTEDDYKEADEEEAQPLRL